MKTKLKKFIQDYPFTILCLTIGILVFMLILNASLFDQSIQISKAFLIKIYTSHHGQNFTLGEGVAALGLIFTVMGLFDKKLDLTLKIKAGITKKLWWIFAIIGLLSLLFASYLNGNVNIDSVFLSPLLWEQVGFLFFIFSPFSLWLGASGPEHLFNPRNSERFYHFLLRTVATGKPEDVEIAVSFIKVNLDKLTTAVNKVESYSFNRPVPSNLQYCLLAQELLDVTLSDKQVADHIVTSRIDFLFSFLHFVKAKNLSRRTIGRGFEKIISQLFENPESYLYKQLNYEGLSSYAPAYETIFGDLFFINEFSVLKMWNSGVRKNIGYDDVYVQVFIRALEEALEAGKFEDQSACDEIAYVLHRLVEFTRNLQSRSTKKMNGFNQGLWYVEHFFGNIFPEKYKKAVESGTISDYELHSKKGDKYRQSLTASYSLALAEFLGEISRGRDKEMERHRAMGITEEILSIIDTGNIYDNLRKCILENIWDQIENNVKRGYFPATLRMYIEIMYWTTDGLPVWYLDERNKLIKYLYEELAPRIINNELMANHLDKKEKELLPENITFDREKGKFYVSYSDGAKSELQQPTNA